MRKQYCWAVILLLPLALQQNARAETFSFGPDLVTAGWAIVSFPRIPPASFKARTANTLEVTTDASAGLLWRALKQPNARAVKARWSWYVEEAVGPTDLSKRDADDRVLAVFFIFGQEADLAKSPSKLLSSASVTALAYVFGGNQPRGSVVPSPHMGPRGKFIVLRPADAPKRRWLAEDVSIAIDYRRAFDAGPPMLLAVAISSDSDDTGRRNRVKLRDFTLSD